MTSVLNQHDSAADLNSSLRSVRQHLPSAGYGIAAAALHDPRVAGWARAQGLTVYAQNADDLELMWSHSIRPVQAVMRCGSTPETVRQAVHAGVARFVVCDPDEPRLLAEFAQRTKYIYLGARTAIPEPHRRLQVIGLHCEVDDFSGNIEWACATEQLLCRLAYLRTCALRPVRLSLTARPVRHWHGRSPEETVAIASTVSHALDEGCRRWRLTRPRMILAPGSAVDEFTMAA